MANMHHATASGHRDAQVEKKKEGPKGMSLVTVPVTPSTAGKTVLKEAQNLAKGFGTRDDIAEDLFKYAASCFNLRLAVFKFIEIDNLIHRQMAGKIAEGKSPHFSRPDWLTALGKALTVLADALDEAIKDWRKNHLDSMKKVFGLSLDQLIEAESVAREYIDALTD